MVKVMEENLLQYTIDKVNQDKLDIITPSLSGKAVSTPRRSHGRNDALDILHKLAPDAARVVESALNGIKVSDIRLRAAIDTLDRVIGKAKVQIDISHEVKPYNWVIRELTESTYSQEIEVTNTIPLIGSEGE